MSNHSVGHEAEKHAAKYLEKQGYKILELNWRTAYCEIDIVVKKSAIVYLVEVKYRVSDAFGTGFDYITAKKYDQMKYAAEIWVNNNRWEGEYQLAAIELSGRDYKVNEFLPLV